MGYPYSKLQELHQGMVAAIGGIDNKRVNDSFSCSSSQSTAMSCRLQLSKSPLWSSSCASCQKKDRPFGHAYQYRPYGLLGHGNRFCSVFRLQPYCHGMDPSIERREICRLDAMLVKLHLPLSKKIGLAFIFAPGGLYVLHKSSVACLQRSRELLLLIETG